MLLEQPGEIVTREQLRQKLWRVETFVGFDHGLNNAVNRLREVLNDSADSPRFIETLPRRGYRFVGSVTVAPAQPSGVAEEQVLPQPRLARNRVTMRGRATVVGPLYKSVPSRERLSSWP